MTRGQLLFSFLCCLPVLAYSDQFESISVRNENVVRITSLLRSGDEKLNFTGSRNVILVLGNTGSGKSTFTQFLAGNNNELIAEEVNDGEYIITDTQNRISNSTVISKTLIPEKVIDRDGKFIVYDCPGFGDTARNEANDIAAAYFIKRVMENVKNIKIVLTVSYPSLRKGVNRNDFFQLLEHISVLIKHVEKYLDGVALIATKVDKSYKQINGVETLLSDDRVIENIAQFLVEVKNSLKTMNNLDQVYKSESKRVKNEVFLKNSNRLLDTLLEKNGTEYSRLSIFRRPDAPGPLSASKLLQREKKVIENILKNHLKYVPVDVADIGYAVSEKSKNVIWELEKEMVEYITSDMARLNRLIVKNFKSLERKMLEDDMYSLIKLLKEAAKALARISSLNGSASVAEMVSHLRQNLPLSCLSASESILGDIASLGKFYKFLQQVGDKQAEPVTSNWINELQPAINYVENSVRWYNFLAELHRRLSKYDIQKDTQRFHVPYLGSKSGPLASITNFSNFFYQISDVDFLKVVSLKELLKINIDDTKVRYFEQVVSSTLRGVPNIIHSWFPSRLLASGEYVKLSDIIENSRYQTIQSLQIFAKHTVFIDADLTKSIDVSIIAPRWVVVGSRTINLNGSPGPKHADSQARDGLKLGLRDGDDGEPGNPGESAGHFFGIGQLFEDITNLKITAVGGKGGIGQNGGNGARGKDGASHNINFNISSKQCDVRCFQDEDCYTETHYSKSNLFNLHVKGKMIYVKYGSKGGRGGNAGRGGAGGMGGDAGSITVFGMGDTAPSISTKTAQGEQGHFGLHGQCGSGGRGGDHYQATYSFGTWSPTKNYANKVGNADDGEPGTCINFSSQSTSNFKDRKQPVPKEFLFPPSAAISQFRTILLADFNNSVTKRHALKFYQTLQKKEMTQYDRVGLIYQELTALEGFYYQLHPDVSKLLYRLLHLRIEEQFEMIKNDSLSGDRKLLQFMSVAVRSHLFRLEDKLEFQQIFNLPAYFRLLRSSNFDEIHNFFTSKAREEIRSASYFVGIIKDNIFDTIERTGTEIIKLSANGNDKLGDYLLKFKLFEGLKTAGEFLTLCCSSALSYLDLTNDLKVGSSLPFLHLTMSGSLIEIMNSNTLELQETLQKRNDALLSSLSRERMTLKALGMEYDEICDQLKDEDKLLRLTQSTLIYQDSSPYSTYSWIVQRVLDLNKQLSKDANVLVQNAATKFSNDVEIIQFSASLYEMLLTQGVNFSSTVSYIDFKDNFKDRVALIDRIVQKLFVSLNLIRYDFKNNPNDLQDFRNKFIHFLNEIKLQVLNMVDHFEIDEDLQVTIENIYEAIDMIAFIYNGILSSQQDRATFKALLWYLENQREMRSEKLEYLIKLTNSNLFFSEYERLLDVYKKYVSPLNAASLLTPPPAPNFDGDLPTFDIIYRNRIARLQSNLNSLAENPPVNSISEEFTSTNERGSFFKWKSQNYNESISKLLRGYEIALKATITNKNLIFLRFSDMKLVFKSDDPEVQQSLDEAMSNFNVIMIHSGRSYFQLGDHPQLINQEPVKFIYKTNESLTEVEDLPEGPSIPTYSPYTTWLFQLKPNNKYVRFSSLLSYRKAAITIELEGNGTYVDPQDNFGCENIHQNDPETFVSCGNRSIPDSSEVIGTGQDEDSTDSTAQPVPYGRTTFEGPFYATENVSYDYERGS